MSVESVNNNQGNNYALAGTIAGVTAGALAGGAYGYMSKPHFNGDELTDKFIKKLNENYLDVQIKR